MTVLAQLRRAHITACGWFWAWAIVGVGAALAAVSLGPILLLPVAAIAAVMARRSSIRRSAFGVLSGVGILLLYVAYLQRHGPGTTCWQTATASGCDHPLNPLPWAIAGGAFFVGGIVAHARRD
jgi:hypothetical protein